MPRHLGVNGKEEFAYESQLFKVHGKKFEDLNMLVRLEVMGTIGRYRQPKGFTELDPKKRGITLGQVRTFVNKNRDKIGADTKGKDLETLIVKDTSLRKCSYVELVAERSLKPQIWVEHSWRSPFLETIAALEWYAEAKGLSDCSTLYFDLLCCNFHTVGRVRDGGMI